jgi:hypothetical protein
VQVNVFSVKYVDYFVQLLVWSGGEIVEIGGMSECRIANVLA